MKTVGWPKFGLKRSSVRQSLLRPLSFEHIQHVEQQFDRGPPADAIVLDRRTSSSDCDDSRREPRGSSSTALIALRQHDLRRRRPRLAAEVLQIGREHEAGPRDVDAAHHPEHVRPIVRQPAARVGEIVGIASERHGLRWRRQCWPGARGGGSAGRLQPGRPRERIGAKRLPAVRSALFDGRDQAVVPQRVPSGFVSRKR